MLSLELGEEVSNLLCPCCGKPYKSVSGFIHKDDNAYSVYFATLQTGHEEICVGLTLSIGKWWDDNALDERHWILLTIHPTPTDFGMRIDEPEASSHANFKHLGIALSRAEALESRLRDQFFEVADFIVENDPAVNSYLRGKPVNISGRICKHEGVIH
jgi:hypothetical protein